MEGKLGILVDIGSSPTSGRSGVGIPNLKQLYCDFVYHAIVINKSIRMIKVFINNNLLLIFYYVIHC